MTELRNSVEWLDDHLEVIDQTALPERFEIAKLATADEVIDAIKKMVVRGAPTLGVCGAYGVALGLAEGRDINGLVKDIGEARPTAANLKWAVDRVAATVSKAIDGNDAYRRALNEARKIHEEDQTSCRRIGEFGRVELASIGRVMTHCNTGRLATSGIGTALGIVYAKAQAGEPIEVVATETRPLLQGARLTTWELAEAGVPVTLISDAAAGAALATHRVDAVLVGCDRVARNGDVANKIGTYSLAVLAHRAGAPFYVAGPLSSFDRSASDGASIEIELRSADELRMVGNAMVAPGVDAWNPAFDVTPAELVTAFITDAGVLRPPYSESISVALESP